MLNVVSIPFDVFPNAENKRADLAYSGHGVDPVCALSSIWRAWFGDLVYATVTSLSSDLWILYHHSVKQGRSLEHCHSLAALNTLPYKDTSLRCEYMCKADACVSVNSCSILRDAAMRPIYRSFLNVSDSIHEAFWVLGIQYNTQTLPVLHNTYLFLYILLTVHLNIFIY